MSDLNARPPTRLVSYRDFDALGIHLSRRWIAELVKHNAFPASIRLTPRRVVWRLADIEAWIDAQAVAPTKPKFRIVK
jgi:predicted DNA-binding transcriptional regulator AlpA